MKSNEKLLEKNVLFCFMNGSVDLQKQKRIVQQSLFVMIHEPFKIRNKIKKKTKKNRILEFENVVKHSFLIKIVLFDALIQFAINFLMKRLD